MLCGDQARVPLGCRRQLGLATGRVKNDVDPVVGALVGVHRKGAGAAVGKNAVSADAAGGRRRQRPIGSGGSSKVVVVGRIIAISMIGNDVDGVGSDRRRARGMTCCQPLALSVLKVAVASNPIPFEGYPATGFLTRLNWPFGNPFFDK